MYVIRSKDAEEVAPATFAELDMKESDIEEILRTSIDMLCGEEESMLIIGRQVENKELGRSDLTAVDNEGNVVLIEIKRDRQDIQKRKEAFEFQAVRYAASYATIESAEEMVEKVYAPYIEKHRNEFELEELTSYELGVRKINEFLIDNDASGDFNSKQRIILLASDYDEQTLSAVAWLNRNEVDISCFKVIPYEINDEIYLYPEKILPPTGYSAYFVDLMEKPTSAKDMGRSTTRRSLPRIDAMLEWGVVEPGDIIVAKNREHEAELLGNGNVMVNGEEMSLQSWLKGVYGWSSVATYAFSVHKNSGKTLSEMREEYMEAQTDEDIL